jgi:hypothetical protein
MVQEEVPLSEEQEDKPRSDEEEQLQNVWLFTVAIFGPFSAHF